MITYKRSSIVFISYVSILCTFLVHDALALDTLKPSLTTQMTKQENIDKKNAIKDRQRANLDRLARLRSERVKKTTTSTSKITPVGNTALRLTPSISPIYSSPQPLPGVDIEKVRTTWFGWYNDYRKSLSLGIYIHDARLDITAHDWNIIFAKGKGSNHHTRNPGDGYYNFLVIDKWFIARGINPKVINRSKHTENVGYGYYRCDQSDCTDELISSIRSTWNFFMSEKGKSYDAHYRSIINPYFTKMGFDIIIVPSENRYYITVHYITE